MEADWLESESLVASVLFYLLYVYFAKRPPTANMLAFSVVDPDPAFKVNPDPDPVPNPNPGF